MSFKASDASLAAYTGLAPRTICQTRKRLIEQNLWDSEYFWLARMWVPATGKKYSEMVEELAIDTLLRETQGERSRTFYPDIPTGAVRYWRCDRCGKWLYAKVEKQRFCGDNCRKSYAAQNPAFKEQRRVYMTKRRQDEKEKQKSSLERARRELRRR